MKDDFKFAIHPAPAKGESMVNWLTRLAKANRMDLLGFLGYFGLFLQHMTIRDAAIEIAQVSQEDYEGLENDLKDRYWEHLDECPINGCEFRTNAQQLYESMGNHLKKAHKLDVFWAKCYLCDQKFRSIIDLRRHIDKKHNQERRKIQCPHCSFMCNDSDSLQRHLLVNHTPEAMIYRCGVCNYSTKWLPDLNRHVKRAHEKYDTPRFCEFCGSVYLDEPSLNRHKDVVHRKKKNYLKGPQTIYRCNQCDYSTVKKHNLKRHMYIKHGARRHKGNLET